MMSEISRSLFCECGHSIRFHHDGKGIYAKGCNQPLGMGMECPCTLDWGTSQPTDQIRDLTAERDKYRDACERLIGHYGNEFNYDPVDFSYRPDVVGQKVFDFARQVKAELEGIEGSEIEVDDE